MKKELTVREGLQFYREMSKGVTDQRRLDIAVDNLNKVAPDWVRFSDIDPLWCRDYTEERRNTLVFRHGEYFPISDATIARELGALKAAANCCLKWKKITINQMATFELPKNLPRREVWLLGDELKTVYLKSAFDPVMHLFVRLLYITGSRRNAIEVLEWSQVDFKRSVIYLNKPGQKVTKKRRPAVPMGALLGDLKAAYDKRENNYVLGSSSDRYRAFMSLLESCGLKEVEERDGRPAGRITPHILRHTRATHLLEAGMSSYAVGKLLGDSAATVEKNYGHACMSKLNEDLEKYS